MSTEMKTCKSCNEEKPVNDFINKNGKSKAILKNCDPCRKIAAKKVKERRQKRKNNPPEAKTEKVNEIEPDNSDAIKCDDCSIFKHKDKFQSVINPTKYVKCCTECRKKKAEKAKSRPKKPAKKCPHNKEKSRCYECKGNSLCWEHCEGKRLKRFCIDCGGSALCTHKKPKQFCKICNGSSICRHNRVKYTCKECFENPTWFCEHGKRKGYCKIKGCFGGSICKHGKQKSVCKECKGSQICDHKKIKTRCIDCDGSEICEHKKLKYFCKECNSAGFFCEHNNHKASCKICQPTVQCEFKDCLFETHRKINMKQHISNVHDVGDKTCDYCAKNVFKLNNWEDIQTKENKKICRVCYNKASGGRNSRVEHDMAKFLMKGKFGPFISSLDKIVPHATCGSKYRPDVLIASSDKLCIFVECDEKQHSGYDKKCEDSRMSVISSEFPAARNFFIRWNPDNYRIENKCQRTPIKKRLENLENLIEKIISENQEKIDNPCMEVYYMYYSDDSDMFTENFNFEILDN